MNLTFECAREADGRWLAEVPQLPGVLAYGRTAIDAVGKAQILAFRVLAERLEAGDALPSDFTLSIIGSGRPSGMLAESAPAPDAPGYAAWLAAEVQEAIDDDGPTMSTEEVMRQVRAAVLGK